MITRMIKSSDVAPSALTQLVAWTVASTSALAATAARRPPLLADLAGGVQTNPSRDPNRGVMVRIDMGGDRVHPVSLQPGDHGVSGLGSDALVLPRHPDAQAISALRLPSATTACSILPPARRRLLELATIGGWSRCKLLASRTTTEARGGVDATPSRPSSLPSSRDEGDHCRASTSNLVWARSGGLPSLRTVAPHTRQERSVQRVLARAVLAAQVG